MREKIDELPFEVDARVAIQLGRESISSSLIAIIELVKNSYDADSGEVEIKFENLNSDNPQLVIKDNGSGLDYNEIIKYWFRIGTNKKRKNSRSPLKDRILTGAKGLGRLGIDRLCEKMTLQSKKDNSKDVFEIDIDWSKYEKEDNDLSKIKHYVFKSNYRDSLFKINESGTALIMTGLKDTWNESSLLELKKELTLLISPFKGINDFNINIKSGLNNKEIDGDIKSTKYLKAADWIVKAQIHSDNTISMKMSSEIFKKHKYQLSKVKWKDLFKDSLVEPRCGPLSFEFYFFITNKNNEDFKKLNLNKANTISFLKNNNGVRIYRDNFRVKPYGDPDGLGDWLTLQHRKAKEPAGIKRKTWVVAGHQIVGAVFISRDKNHQLIDQTNREGIVEEAAFYDLRKFALRTIQWFELNRYEFESKRVDKADKARELKKAVEENEEVINTIFTSIMNDLKNPNKSKEDLSEAISDLKDNFDENKNKVNALENILESEKNTLANLASIGILAASFGHETAEQSASIATSARELKYNYDKGTLELFGDYKNNFEQYLDIIIDSSKFIESFANFTIGNIKTDKRRQKEIDLVETINNIKNNMLQTLKLKNIEIDASDLPGEKIVYVKGFEIDLESIFINLISNSVEALKDITDRIRLIKISLEYDNKNVSVLFQDSGCGLEKDTKQHIFEATFSTKRDEKGNLIGTGMGLAIVKSFIEEHLFGTITVQEKSTLGGVGFKMTIPRLEKGINNA